MHLLFLNNFNKNCVLKKKFSRNNKKTIFHAQNIFSCLFNNISSCGKFWNMNVAESHTTACTHDTFLILCLAHTRHFQGTIFLLVTGGTWTIFCIFRPHSRRFPGSFTGGLFKVAGEHSDSFQLWCDLLSRHPEKF
jgi:hypothetical protein